MGTIRKAAMLAAAASLAAVAVFPVPYASAKGARDDTAVASSSNAPLADRTAAQMRLAPGGVKISENEIAWEDGRVIMSFPFPGQRQAPPSSPAALRVMQAGSPRAQIGTTEPTGPESIEGCPTQIIGPDYYCFYEHINWVAGVFSSRMLGKRSSSVPTVSRT